LPFILLLACSRCKIFFSPTISLSGLAASPHPFFLAPCFTSPWELNHGHASSTLRHFKDLTEQRPHHFSLSLSLSFSFSWCAGRLWTLLLLARVLLRLEFLLGPPAAAMAIQVVVAPVLITSCWLKNGAWRAPCDDPSLAKTLDSTCFCQIWFASKVGVGLSTFFFLSLSLSLYTPSTRLVFSFMVLAGPLLHEFSSPLSTTHIISSPLFHDLSDARTQW
jgi:hypothetical protein